jgi:dimeric dUTPase (all-alpha-NTP-PPase superfamily)
MNITHATEEQIIGDKLQAIFKRQSELMEKYHDIEARSGLLQTPFVPVNINDKRGQARIKDFAWRLTEELGEALDALSHEEHFQEELIDGLHFLTELTILAGKDYNSIIPNTIDVENIEGDYLDKLHAIATINYISTHLADNIMIFIRELGMMCNCLKNKPWKQSQMLTDMEAFNTRLYNTWVAYIGILEESGLLSEDIANIYLKKSQVNQFRQRSNY